MPKRFFIFMVFVFAGILLAGNVAFSESQPSSPVEKALGDVKGTFDSLINAKDENSLQELSFRIETYKKVIDFVLTEARDLKVKLLAIDHVDEHLVPWQEESLQNLARAGEYYEAQKKLLGEKEKTLTMEQLQELARNFKKERDERFLPTVDQIKDFLVIYQEKGSIDTAKNRWSKIQDDVKKLQKSRVKMAGELASMLEKASRFINEAQTLNRKAEQLFWNSYAYFATTTMTASSTNETAGALTSATVATSAEQITTSSPSNAAQTQTSTTTAVNSTSTISIATSTATSTEPAVLLSQPPSIRDLVRSSLMKIKEAYQVFIEMSSLVRKGLK